MHSFGDTVRTTCQLLISRSYKCSSGEYFCLRFSCPRWNDQNNYGKVLKGLVQLDCLDVAQVISTVPEFLAYIKKQESFASEGCNVYRIINKKKLRQWAKNPPVETAAQWRALVEGKELLPVECRDRAPTITDAVAIVLQVADASDDPLVAIVSATEHLNRELKRRLQVTAKSRGTE